MVRELPTHNGYTVDERLKQFRRVTWDSDGNPGMDFVDFDSAEAEQLLATSRLPERPSEPSE